MGAIRLTTEIPGPESRAMLARRAASVAAGLAKSTEVAVRRAHGALVEDVDGNTLIDMAGGIGMLAVGHSPESVVEAMHAQARDLIHVCSLVATYEPYVKLCEVLNAITPGAFAKKSLLANSGAESVENAIKIARAYTKRPAVITFEGAYHGRTLLTLTLTSKYALFKKNFGPFAPEVYRLPIPNPYRTPPGMSAEAYVDWSAAQLENALIVQVDPSAVGAIIVEPVQGEAGFIPVPGRFLAKIREICDKHGIVMIADEVQSGFGRTGTLFAIEQMGVVPDLIVMAKSMGAGMPISAVTGKAEIMDATHLGGLGGTYGGNPVACVAALEAIKTIRAPGFLERARAIGTSMRRELERWKEECPLVGDVRGLGPMMLLELVKDRETKEPAPQETLEVIKKSVARGLLIIRAGIYSNCVRLLPPLVITDEQLMEALAALRAALFEVAASGRAKAAR